ncbi:MAG: uroporphyrinogen-III C-methyltransferase [Alphaproteobacteria bacterium]|nr:uroporphyrinogen-III C-methyltransferase [Alphaproteobacteria bacterium]
MRFLPVFLDLTSGPIVLVGSGTAATAKLHLLRAAGAHVRWFSPEIDVAEELLLASHYAGRIGIAIGEPGEDDLAGALAVVSAAGSGIDERIAQRARALSVPVNVVDRPDLSTFVFPAIVDRGDVVVATGTGGASPVLARRLRERIEAILPARIGEFAAMMSRYRDRIAAARKRYPGLSLRRFWERVIDGPIGAAFHAGRTRDAEAALAMAIDNAGTSATKTEGIVHLVGAGPGDPDLLTLRALHALQAADAIFYDDLVGPDILGRARRDAELIFVGKRKGEPGIGQAEINRRLAAAAKAGRRVVRLKGGDPFIFGRGGEELEHLRQEGIPVHVVPGITAALGCAAEAGLPLTFRSEATRLALVTANTAEGPDNVDWNGLADPQTTVIVYMGLTAAEDVRRGLIGAGRDPQTPAAVLARGTRPDAVTAVGRLDDLPALAASAGDGPALLVIGYVVARSEPWRTQQDAAIEVAA